MMMPLTVTLLELTAVTRPQIAIASVLPVAAATVDERGVQDCATTAADVPVGLTLRPAVDVPVVPVGGTGRITGDPPNGAGHWMVVLPAPAAADAIWIRVSCGTRALAHASVMRTRTVLMRLGCSEPTIVSSVCVQDSCPCPQTLRRRL